MLKRGCLSISISDLHLQLDIRYGGEFIIGRVGSTSIAVELLNFARFWRCICRNTTMLLCEPRVRLEFSLYDALTW